MRGVTFSFCRIGLAWLTLGYGIACWGAVTCSVSTSGLDFGDYDPLATQPRDFNGSIVASCTLAPPPGQQTAAYQIALSTGGSGTFASRRLTGGSEALRYNVYTNANHTQVWGDGTGGSQIVTGTFSLGPGAAQRTRNRTHTARGRLEALQDVGAGVFVDVLVVTISF